MANFYGSRYDDLILRTFLSPGVNADPAGTDGTLTGEPNFIEAGAGSDSVRAGDGGDSIYGEDGNDWLFGGAGSDFLSGGAGRDRLVSGNNLTGEYVVLHGGTGADVMIGRTGQQFFVVDSYADVVFDTGHGEEDDYDTIVTNLDYALIEGSGVDALDFNSGWHGLEERAATGIGNSGNNWLSANGLGNRLFGLGGSDTLFGGTGDDLLHGGRGADEVTGWDGRDVCRGQNGDDHVWGGSGVDRLVGGRGRDTFFFNYATDSGPDEIDRIVSGDGSIAFQGAGAADGDVIWLPNAIKVSEWIDFTTWTFGGTGKGAVSCVEAGGGRTLVRGNLDDDPAFEFQVLIADGAVRASAYTLDDFTW